MQHVVHGEVYKDTSVQAVILQNGAFVTGVVYMILYDSGKRITAVITVGESTDTISMQEYSDYVKSTTGDAFSERSLGNPYLGPVGNASKPAFWRTHASLVIDTLVAMRDVERARSFLRGFVVENRFIGVFALTLLSRRGVTLTHTDRLGISAIAEIPAETMYRALAGNLPVKFAHCVSEGYINDFEWYAVRDGFMSPPLMTREDIYSRQIEPALQALLSSSRIPTKDAADKLRATGYTLALNKDLPYDSASSKEPLTMKVRGIGESPERPAWIIVSIASKSESMLTAVIEYVRDDRGFTNQTMLRSLQVDSAMLAAYNLSRERAGFMAIDPTSVKELGWTPYGCRGDLTSRTRLSMMFYLIMMEDYILGQFLSSPFPEMRAVAAEAFEVRNQMDLAMDDRQSEYVTTLGEANGYLFTTCSSWQPVRWRDVISADAIAATLREMKQIVRTE